METIQELEAFTCIMYGEPRGKSVNLVRLKMLKKMVGEDDSLNQKSKIDLSRIPPCQDSFIPHCQRANHRLGRYKRANDAIIEYPKPYEPGQGWGRKERGEVEPVCDESPRFLPISNMIL